MHTAVSYIARLSWALTKSQSGKEGRAFRNIGKNIYIFSTVKSAMPLLFYIFTYCCLDPSLGFGPSFFRSWSLLSPRTVDAFPVVASLPSRPEMRLLFAGKSLLWKVKNGGTLAKITILNRTELHRTSVNPFQKACFRYSYRLTSNGRTNLVKYNIK